MPSFYHKKMMRLQYVNHKMGEIAWLACRVAASSNSDFHLLMSNIFVMRKEHEKAIAETKRAIALNPNNANAYCFLGYMLCLSDRPVEGIEYIKKAIQLNPSPPSMYLVVLGHAYRAAGQYDNALESYNKSLKTGPNNIFAYIGLAATYSLTGREKEAREAGLEVLKIDPEFSLKDFAKIVPIRNQDELKRYIGAIHKAGLN
jgi:adenylate cyclase